MTKTLILFGPTAVGKTSYSIDLAHKLNAEIISADSMQVYRYMDIGTAKPTISQRQEIPHHLIDIVNPDESWTVADFLARAQSCILDIKNRNKVPLIVGGTGLYLNSLINGYDFPVAPKNDEIRSKLSKLTEDELYLKLSNIDSDSSNKINKNDKKRMMRALEVFELTGIPMSKLQKKNESDKKSFELICLNMDRDKLYKRINERVDNMLKLGLIDEVKSLLEKGYSDNLTSMQALGYKETIGYLQNKSSYDEMVELIKKKTRNFARRQMTWFRRFENVKWVDMENEGMSSYV